MAFHGTDDPALHAPDYSAKRAPQRMAGTESSATPSRMAEKAWLLAKTIGGAGSVLSIIWSAYTYSDQHVEQRRQDLLQAFDLVNDKIGPSAEKKIGEALSPLYKITDDQWWNAKTSRDNADTSSAIQDMQNWITENILVKSTDHDGYIHNYQDALNSLKFLRQYADTDACNAMVVALRFQTLAYDFFYYYPGSFEFSQSRVTTKLAPEPAQDIGNPKWAQDKIDRCTESLKPMLPRIRDWRLQQRPDTVAANQIKE